MTVTAPLAILMLLAAEQSADTAIEQITGSVKAPSSAVATNQISNGSGKMPGGTTPSQIGTPSRVVPPAQSAPKTSVTNQLMVSKPTADAPSSGSTPQQGKNTHTETVKGNDRCDPQSGQGGDACKNVIETRSNEFAPPDTEPLSPEQNLMVSQQDTEAGRDVTSGTRRLANGEVDDSNVGLAVSSYASTTTGTPGDSAKAENSPTTNAIVSAVVSIVQGSAR